MGAVLGPTTPGHALWWAPCFDETEAETTILFSTRSLEGSCCGWLHRFLVVIFIWTSYLQFLAFVFQTTHSKPHIVPQSVRNWISRRKLSVLFRADELFSHMVKYPIGAAGADFKLLTSWDFDYRADGAPIKHHSRNNLYLQASSRDVTYVICIIHSYSKLIWNSGTKSNEKCVSKNEVQPSFLNAFQGDMVKN